MAQPKKTHTTRKPTRLQTGKSVSAAKNPLARKPGPPARLNATARAGVPARPQPGSDAAGVAPLDRDELIRRAYYLEARHGFPSDRALADALGVHRSQISRWSQGKLATRENAWLLRDLASAVSRLTDHFEPTTIQKWLFAANPEMDDEQPMEALRQGRLPEVLMAIEAQTSGAFA